MNLCRRAQIVFACAVCALAALQAVAQESENDPDQSKSAGSEILPDIRDDESKLKYQKGDLVVVPIPIADPTLGNGLVLGGGYFWPQTGEQKAAQPASVTGAAGLYTSSDSKAFGIGQNNYWGGDKWRFEGVAGYADLKLPLRVSDDPDSEAHIDWLISGTFLYADLLRQISGNWYAGLQTRYLSMDQSFATDEPPPDGSGEPDTQAVGLGFRAQYDSRDMPFNSYTGRFFDVEGLFNSKSLGSDNDYEKYKAKYRSYHSLKSNVVVAWELQGCTVAGKAALWDVCTIPLRGFAATEFMGTTTVSGQAEARWHFSPRWGVVGFAGVGQVDDALSNFLEGEPVPSYGLGLRFMVLKSHRINLRFDYARSRDNDAIYLSVGEAF